MVKNNLEKIRLLLWKNWAIERTKKCRLILQLLFPTFLIMFLVYLRQSESPVYYEGIVFKKPLPLDLEIFTEGHRETQGLTNIPVKFHLAYSPNTSPVYEKIVSEAAKNLKLTYSGYRDRETLQTQVVKNNYICGVEFVDPMPNRNTYPKKLEYRVRFPHESRTNIADFYLGWHTGYFYAPESSLPPAGPRSDFLEHGGPPAAYLSEGFLAVQNEIFMAFLSQSTKADNLPKIFLQRYPYPEIIEDPFYKSSKLNISILTIMGYIMPFAILIQNIAIEKEKQIKEVLKIMGLQSWIHWVAWFTKAFIMMSFSSLLITFILKFELDDMMILNYSSFTAVFLIFLLYSVASITLCFFLSTCFSKATSAAAMSAFIWIVMIVPFAIFSPEYEFLSSGAVLIMCMLPNTAMCFAMQLILTHESFKDGLQWSNIFEIPPGDIVSMAQIMCMMILSSILYMALCLYVEQINPGEFGIPKKWDFPFHKSFWCDQGHAQSIDDSSNEGSIGRPSPVGFDAEPVGKRAGVEVMNLSKSFGNFNAVKGLSLNMYEDEITVLLGHNGAGKTTTISMLTGMFPPTSGTAIINGCDIRTDIDSARRSMAICPQHNILFDNMTVKDHLIFYSRLKGLKGSALNSEVTKYLTKIDLDDKANVASSKLSGGMKRKLCVCIAMCGGTKVLMFDEPSAGMDPVARRQLWSLLQSEKIGRTILLTTHYMDEADVLGDRIAIMSAGELKSMGTAFFLKKQYGSGYKLICVKRPNCDVSKVTRLLSKYIPNIVPEDEIGAELSYQLPEAYSSNFERMLQDLEKNSEQLQVEGYGISIHSLEDVVMKMDAEKEKTKLNTRYRSSSSLGIHTGSIKLLNQWRSMILKKYLYIRRNMSLYLLMFFTPIIILLPTFLFLSEVQNYSKPVTPSLSQFLKTVTILDISPNVQVGSLEARISENFKNIIKSYGPQHKLMQADSTGFINFILKLGEKIQPAINKMYVAAVTVDKGRIIAWLNNELLHSAPLTVNLIHNAMAKSLIGPDASIVITNEPLPRSSIEGGSVLSHSISQQMQTSMCLLTAYYIIFLVMEYQSRAKLLELVSGVKVLTFWLSHFVSDMILFTMISISIIIMFFCLQEENLKTFNQLGVLFILFMVYGCAAIMLTYLMYDCFMAPSQGFLLISILNLICGFEFNDIYNLVTKTSPKLAEQLLDFFRIYPHFTFQLAFVKMYMNSDLHSLCQSLPVPDPCAVATECCALVPYFSSEYPGVGPEMTYLSLTALVLFIVLLLKEYRVLQNFYFKLTSKIRSPSVKSDNEFYDDDVDKEKRLIMRMSSTEIARQNLVLDRLTKFYGKFVAVNQMSILVKKSECFGMLGINGAGKTTTFKMLTGDLPISAGEAYVKGYRIKTQMRKIYPEIGYCPQFDGAFEDFTGYENLRIFSLLRGIPISKIPQYSKELANDFGFTELLDKEVRTYSGGNKRKLSTALAVLGSPSVIYLDEPTAGMDLVARRQIWSMFSRIRGAGSSIILSSHNMEECEALCTRVAMMVNGEIKCLGSIQHLKNKFSRGFILKIKLRKERESITQSVRSSEDTYDGEEEANIARVVDFISREFPNAYSKEQFQSIITFYIPSAGVLWSRIFGLMEANKGRLKIEDYLLTQTTLEQIFLEFAQHQREE